MKPEALTPVEGSSQIKAIGHDGNSLFVQFHNKSGGVSLYRYWPKEGATDHDHAKLLEHHGALPKAESAGKFFNQHVRDHFAFEKVSA